MSEGDARSTPWARAGLPAGSAPDARSGISRDAGDMEGSSGPTLSASHRCLGDYKETGPMTLVEIR